LRRVRVRGDDRVIKGIDVSNNQPRIDWERVRGDGVEFAIIKATEGVGFVDERRTAYAAGARAAGLVCGFYHYARPDTYAGNTARAAIQDAEAEADAFLATAFPTAGDLLPTLDLEEAGLPPRRLVAWTRAWLSRVEERIGAKPMLYTYPGFWGRMSGSRAFGSYPLWIAHWEAVEPQLPPGWSSYALWQYSSSGSVQGIPGRVDLNRLADGLGLPDLTYQAASVVKEEQNLPGPVPKPQWFWPWLRWRLGVGEFEGLTREKSIRPDEAPERAPGWALACEKKLRGAREG
jgi:GH25 family lysozyme M1 (1,4-beta-N-acetylmuramidase)